jgi:hypothetical protein
MPEFVIIDDLIRKLILERIKLFSNGVSFPSDFQSAPVIGVLKGSSLHDT